MTGNCVKTKFRCITETMESVDALGAAISNFTAPQGSRPYVVQYPLTITEVNCNSGEKGKEKWLIQQGVGDINDESQFWRFVKTIKPRHGIAALLPPLENKRDSGKLFCLLPLPESSGVPVHINGCFELDANRQSLKVLITVMITDVIGMLPFLKQ